MGLVLGEIEKVGEKSPVRFEPHYLVHLGMYSIAGRSLLLDSSES